MRKKTSKMMALALIASCLLILAGTAMADEAQNVANKTFNIWVSQSFSSPPYDPFPDCARFTGNTMFLDGCGDSGPLVDLPLFGSPLLSLWIGVVPCGGLNLLFIGTSFDGSALGEIGADVMGGFGIGLTELSSFGIEGVANANCALPAAEEGGNPYSAQ